MSIARSRVSGAADREDRGGSKEEPEDHHAEADETVQEAAHRPGEAGDQAGGDERDPLALPRARGQNSESHAPDQTPEGADRRQEETASGVAGLSAGLDKDRQDKGDEACHEAGPDTAAIGLTAPQAERDEGEKTRAAGQCAGEVGAAAQGEPDDGQEKDTAARGGAEPAHLVGAPGALHQVSLKVVHRSSSRRGADAPWPARSASGRSRPPSPADSRARTGEASRRPPGAGLPAPPAAFSPCHGPSPPLRALAPRRESSRTLPPGDSPPDAADADGGPS